MLGLVLQQFQQHRPCRTRWLAPRIVESPVVWVSDMFAKHSLISWTRDWKTCSTLYAFWALVSINRMPKESASSLASSYETTFFEERSHLLPTSNLLTPFGTFFSISSTQCLTLLNDSLSVTS